jgi:hypothetical protein
MNIRLSLPRLRQQRGQALTEFVVAAIVLVPLFMIVPLIGKYQDISFQTQMASRYVAFEATTFNDSTSAFKPEAQLADEVRRRFFSNPDAPIKTNDVAGNFAANRNSLWVDYKNDPMISDFGKDVQLTFGFNGATTHSGAFTSTATPFKAQASVVQSALGLKDRGIYTAQIEVTLAEVAWPKFELANNGAIDPLDKFKLALNRHTSVVIDNWSARDSSDVENKINNEAIFPVKGLAPIVSTVGPIVSVIDTPLVQAPKIGKLDFWRDVVPKDRLK